MQAIGPLLGTRKIFGSSIGSMSVSIIGVLFFAFHPTLFGWFGAADTQQNQIHLLLAFLVLITFIKSINKNSFNYYILSCFLFFLMLLLRENLILFPLVIFVLMRLFPALFYAKNTGLLSQIKLFFGFGFVIFLYFGLRFWAYPVVFHESGHLLDLFRN